MPADELAKDYALLLYAAQTLRKTEHDPNRLIEIMRIERFADSTYKSILEGSTMAGPPAPSAAAAPPQATPSQAGGATAPIGGGAPPVDTGVPPA
jgi:hypothetical protein